MTTTMPTIRTPWGSTLVPHPSVLRRLRHGDLGSWGGGSLEDSSDNVIGEVMLGESKNGSEEGTWVRSSAISTLLLLLLW
jgi:hypothetical protein